MVNMPAEIEAVTSCHQLEVETQRTARIIQTWRNVPQHGPRRWRRLVQLFISFGFSRHLFVNVACRNAHPQGGRESGVVQQDAHLKEIM